MASSIFAEPEDPHAHRRNNPPGGKPTGVLCGEPSAPLRRCHAQPAVQNDSATEKAATTGDGDNETEVPDHAEEPEPVQEQKEAAAQPSASTPSAGAPGTRRNPPGGKSSLILG